MWAAALRPTLPAMRSTGRVSTAGSRSASRPSTRATWCTSGASRLFAPADREQAILLGDYLYAAGLVEICRAGELRAVTTLAELIATVFDRARAG